MNKLLLYTVFALFATNIYAQIYPRVGATWVFQKNAFQDPSDGILWEYLGDSVVANNRYLKFNTITLTKTYDPILLQNTYSKEYGNFKLIERNDSIFYEYPIQGRSFICNFNLTTGDSTLSPLFHDWVSAGYASPNCHSQIPNGANIKMLDSLMLFEKAYVVNHGTDMIGGQSFAYYTIQYNYYNYLDPNAINNPIIRYMTFHQRSLFSLQGTNVPWESFHVCDYGIDDSYMKNELTCFNDDLNEVNDCKLSEDLITYHSLNDIGNSFTVRVFPNPAKNHISIEYFENSKIYVSVLDMSGRAVKAPYLLDKNNYLQMDISNLMPGMYLIRFINTEGQVFTQKIIKE